MKLIQRLGYYLGGFSIGLIILAFFFNAKKTSCSYGPEARVLKKINLKTRIYSNALEVTDTFLISHILKQGNIKFSKSFPRKKPCGVYVVEGNYNNEDYTLTFENCDSLVKVIESKKLKAD